MRQKFYSAIFLLGILATALPASGNILTVTSTADSGAGSLRDAILAAAPGDTIDFSLPNPSTIFLDTGSLVIANDLTISGPGSSSLKIGRAHV